MARAAPLIRLLGPADRGAFRALRAQSLATDAAAFGRTGAEEAGAARIGIEAALEAAGPATFAPATFAFGAVDADGALLGMLVAFQGDGAKMRHWATINAMYVRPEARGQGLGAALVRAALERLAAAGLEAAKLTVIAEPPAARRFYERLGFAAYGIEPAGLRLGQHAWDLVLMRRALHP